MEWVRNIKKLYQKYKRALLYLDLLFVVIVLYAGKYLGSLREQLLPAAIAGAFAILLETLFSITDALQKKDDATEYTSITLALPKIVQILSSKTEIRIPVSFV